jgi:signal transduction histidine kinase
VAGLAALAAALATWSLARSRERRRSEEPLGSGLEMNERAGSLSERERAERERSRLQQVIERAALEWRRTFDALESSILILDAEGRVVRLNRAAAACAGREPQACPGLLLEEMGAGQPWTAARGLLLQAGAGPTAFEPVRDPASGRWWDLAATHVEDDGASRWIVLARDVTTFVALQEAAREVEHMAAMGSITAGVAHEVRNPLFAISANVDALGCVLEDRSEIAELLHAVRAEVKRVNGLMVDLLQYGRPAAPELSSGQLDAALELALGFVSAQAREKGVELVTSGSSHGQTVMIDRERMAEALENLLENAIQHSSPGGVVRAELSLVQHEGRSFVRCAVADGGPGFRTEDLARVFEPFFTRRRGGTGLGLSIAHKTVMLHGGLLHAENRCEGGAVLVLELPCLPDRGGPLGPPGARDQR